METVHQIIIGSVSGGFFRFLGYWMMLLVIFGIPAKVITLIINRPFRHYSLMKLGYPPKHCDADGDLKEEK